MTGRLTAALLDAQGKSTIEGPRDNEDLFLYVTDGAGSVTYDGQSYQLGQYDVILARPELEIAEIQSSDDNSLQYMSFYLPSFIAS